MTVDPELQRQLAGYLDRLDKTLDRAQGFAEAEVPLLVREWLTWLAVERFTYAAAFAAMAALAFFPARALWRLDWRDDQGVPFSRGAAIPLYVASALFLVCGAGGWALDGVKVLVAPRVTVVEELAKLTRGSARAK